MSKKWAEKRERKTAGMLERVRKRKRRWYGRKTGNMRERQNGKTPGVAVPKNC